MPEKTEYERATEWLASDDVGESSKAILRHMMGLKHDRWGASYPVDGGDFGRCFRLLEVLPEWRQRMPEMAAHSPQWAALVEVWGALEEKHRAGKPVYADIQAAIRPAEDNDPNMVRLSDTVSLRFGKIGA